MSDFGAQEDALVLLRASFELRDQFNISAFSGAACIDHSSSAVTNNNNYQQFLSVW